MEFLGIGPLEVIFIVLIALVLLGPSDMLKAARTVGRILRTVFTSEGWREMRRSMNTLRNLPTSMMREAGLEEDLRTISEATQLQIPAIDISKGALSASPTPGEETQPGRRHSISLCASSECLSGQFIGLSSTSSSPLANSLRKWFLFSPTSRR